MGMAASQARYLGLTARKTNVEYEGQQVNQQRTALANQTANLFNQLLTMEVPTPPSTQDYTTLQYTYSDGFNTETITKMQALGTSDPDYNYMVTHHHYSDVYTGVGKKMTDPQVATDFKVNASSYTNPTVAYDTTSNSYEVTPSGSTSSMTAYVYDPTDANQAYWLDEIQKKQPGSNVAKESNINNIFVYEDAENVLHFSTKSDLDNIINSSSNTLQHCFAEYTPTYIGNCELSKYDASDEVQAAAVKQIKENCADTAFAQSPDDEIYTYMKNNIQYYACLSDLTKSAASAPDPTNPLQNQDKLAYYNAANLSTKIETTEKAMLETGEDGRFTSVRYEDSTAAYSLNCETITDDVAYQDAMNQYNYKIQQYEKTVQDINAKTEVIQAEDRTLELRLKQLDTEQEALQTEMEAVKKVIDKNIETTFKTFN